jgi:hypothetical protein
MKPFNLTEALAGKPVCDRLGRLIKEIHQFKWLSIECRYPVTYIDYRGWRNDVSENGEANKGFKDDRDLFMQSTKKEGWINLYRSGNGRPIPSMTVYDTEKIARQCAAMEVVDTVHTVRIEWEE